MLHYLCSATSSSNLKSRVRGTLYGLMGMTLPLLLLMTFLISTQHKLLQSVLGKDLVDTLGIYLVSSTFKHGYPHVPENSSGHNAFYCKILKYSETWKIAVIIRKLNNVALPWSNETQRCSWNGKQCRPWSRGAVWSGSTLFAQTCLSENLGSLRYMHIVSTRILFLGEFYVILMEFRQKHCDGC